MLSRESPVQRSAIHARPDGKHWVRARVSGTTTVRGQIRLWKDGTTEPVPWAIDWNDTTPSAALEGSGHVGIRFQLGGSYSGGFPVTASVDDFTGITLSSLDNPGWFLTVNLVGTELEGSDLEYSVYRDDEPTWVHCSSKGNSFEAACGPLGLEFAIEQFKAFATSAGKGRGADASPGSSDGAGPLLKRRVG